MVGRDEDHAVLEEHRAVDVVHAVPAGIAQHDEPGGRAAAARYVGVGRSDGRQNAVHVHLVVGHDDEYVVGAVVQQRRQVARIAVRAGRRMDIFIGMLLIVRIAEQRQYLLLELLVRTFGVDQRYLPVPVHQFGGLFPFVRRVGRHLEQHVAVHARDVGQRRNDGHVVLLGEPDDRIQPLLVDRTDDQVGIAEGVALGDFADFLRIAGRVIQTDVHRIAVFGLHAVQSEQESLIKLQIAGIGGAGVHRQQQGDIERRTAPQCAEFDLLHPVVGGEVGYGVRAHGVGRLPLPGGQLFGRTRNLDDRSGFQVGGFQPSVERAELLFGDAEAA